MGRKILETLRATHFSQKRTSTCLEHVRKRLRQALLPTTFVEVPETRGKSLEELEKEFVTN